MRKPWIAAAAVTVFLLWGVVAALGQTPGPICGPRSEIEKQLADQYHERLRVQALSDGGRMLLIYVADDDTTYTVIMAAPNINNVCVVDSGQWWSEQKRGPEKGA